MSYASLRHTVRYFGPLAAVLIGWWLLMADSAGPQFKRSVDQQYGDVAIAIDSTGSASSYDCYPHATFNPGVYAATLIDAAGTQLVAVQCLMRADCLTEIALGTYVVSGIYTCNSADWEPSATDSGDGCPACGGSTDAVSDDGYSRVQCALYGAAGAPDAFPSFEMTFTNSDGCYGSDAQTYTLTVERSDGAVSRIVYTQTKEQSKGYCGM
jgi:hypothetical protein